MIDDEFNLTNTAVACLWPREAEMERAQLRMRLYEITHDPAYLDAIERDIQRCQAHDLAIRWTFLLTLGTALLIWVFK